MINYLFYRFSKMKIHKPTYWAKIFVPVIEVAVFMPAVLTLSKYFFGCYDSNTNDGTIKIILSVVVVLVWAGNSFYYSPQRIKKINDRYSSESKVWGNLKLILICMLLLVIFMLGSTTIRYFMQIPEC